MRLSMAIVLLLFARLFVVRAQDDPPGPAPDWRTLDHSPGRCAMYGVCGHRHDGDPLNCAANVASVPPSETLAARLQAVCPSLWAEQGGPAGRYCCTADQVDRISSDTQKALPFIVGCPACRHNFVQIWCVLTCSPDQATFANVTAVQAAADNNATAVAEVDYWLTAAYSTELYDSCKDVKFGAANVPAMSFIGGGARSGQEWLDFLGTLKDRRFPPIGSPIQLNFRPGNSTPPGLTPLRARVVSCGDNAFRCSCSDCPAAQGCAQPDPSPPGPSSASCYVGALSCLSFALIWVYLAGAAAVVAAFLVSGRLGAGTGRGGRHGLGGEAEEPEATTATGGAKAAEGRDLLEPLLSGAADGPGGPVARAGAGGGPGGGGAGGVPLVERLLQQWYYRLGLFVGRHPVTVGAVGAALVALCCVGLVRFRVETDPQRLWVGPTSQAAREKAAYEASFGPFYRVEQMILATTASPSPSPSANGPGRPPPPIVTPANIRLLFDFQAMVDELEAPLEVPGSPPRTVRLYDICYKPFGDACATQSVLQYWRLNRTLYDSEQARSAGSPGRMTPEYCFLHWYTECRSAFQAPMDPHVVLGGFPRGPAFTNYSSGATAFVTTYPVSSDPALLPASRAWEAAFLRLAADKLGPAAAAANLTLSFSTERSVQDELTRESRADAATVAASYGIMLLYIAAALGSFPPPWSVWWAARGRGLAAAGEVLRRAALTSRASLGLAGVVIVAASVAGALGLVSAVGLWCTLIIMEVIPFLVLAVGVDNMFVLAHAMGKQDHSLPVHVRLASALSAAGPSITLAAACEVAAFALGGLLTSMPAVRNFSLAAAAAVALDFGLQITVFAALLVLDVRRLQARRVDCLPCLQLGGAGEGPGGQAAASRRAAAAAAAAAAGAAAGHPYSPPLGAAATMTTGGGSLYDKDNEPPYIGPSSEGEVDEHSYWSLQRVLQAYFDRFHAPLLARPAVQCVVLLLFGATLAASLAALPSLQVGLDQAVALPRDSYLQPYYRDILRYLRVGPPLLLVVRDLDLDPAARQVERLCGVSGCDADSLANRVSAAARDPDRTFIAASAASWLDDFMSWLTPDLPVCCRSRPEPAALASASSLSQLQLQQRQRGQLRQLGRGPLETPLEARRRLQAGGAGSYCPPPDQPPCAGNATACASCRTCVQAAFEGGRPSVPQFQTYLPWFLAAKPSEQCAKGGVGAYSDALQRADPADPTSVAGLLPEPSAGKGGQGGRVAASSFRTYYRPLSEQSDFIEALRQARAFAARASRELQLDVYAYSLFHVFFEQYLSVAHDAVAMVGLPLLAVVAAAWALSGSLWSAGLMAAVLASLLVHLGGAMWLAGIQVNAVSLVNLAMALGIAVEFCAHIMHAYIVAPSPPPATTPEDGDPTDPAAIHATLAASDAPASPRTHPDTLASRLHGTALSVSAFLATVHRRLRSFCSSPSPSPSLSAAAACRASRSAAALRSVGASVLSGVTLTKLVGVAVLAFARTQIFEVYYFRLYLALVVTGAAHGLVLLPVLLSLAGPPEWGRKD